LQDGNAIRPKLTSAQPVALLHLDRGFAMIRAVLAPDCCAGNATASSRDRLARQTTCLARFPNRDARRLAALAACYLQKPVV